MNEKKFCDVIVELRKEKGLTQQDIANKLNITDKAVSKWERGLSYPDITSISKLASILDVDSSYLIDGCKNETNPYIKKNNIKAIIPTILKTVGMAMGIAVMVIGFVGEIQIQSTITMLAIGLSCIGLSLLSENKI